MTKRPFRRAREWLGIVGKDFVKEVTCKNPYTWDPSGEMSKPFTVVGTNLPSTFEKNTTHRLVAFDYGAKRAIYKNLRRFGFEVIVLARRRTSRGSHIP